MRGPASRRAPEQQGEPGERRRPPPRGPAEQARADDRARRRPRRRASAANAPAPVSTPRPAPCAHADALDGRARGAARRRAPRAGATIASDELVDPAARVPGAEGVLDVPGDGERRRRAPRVGAGVGREALDDHPQPRVARRRAGEVAQRPPRLHAQRVARVRRRLARPRPARRQRRRAGEEALRRAPHRRAQGEEAHPVGARARRPLLERRQRARQVGGQVEPLPSAKRYRVTGSTRTSRARSGAPVSANSATHGIVSSEGPASHTKPSRSHAAAFPPGAAAALEHGHLVARRARAASPRRARRRRRRRRRTLIGSRARAGTANAPIASRAGRRHARAPPETRVRERLADPRPRRRARGRRRRRRRRGRARATRRRRRGRSRTSRAKFDSRHALVAPAARPRPVALAHHPRVEEHVPRGQRAGGERHPRERRCAIRPATTHAGRAIIAHAAAASSGTPPHARPELRRVRVVAERLARSRRRRARPRTRPPPRPTHRRRAAARLAARAEVASISPTMPARRGRRRAASARRRPARRRGRRRGREERGRARSARAWRAAASARARRVLGAHARSAARAAIVSLRAAGRPRGPGARRSPRARCWRRISRYISAAAAIARRPRRSSRCPRCPARTARRRGAIWSRSSDSRRPGSSETEPLQRLAGEVDAAVRDVLVDVAQDVRALHRHARAPRRRAGRARRSWAPRIEVITTPTVPATR